jgi:hypothetical protein
MNGILLQIIPPILLIREMGDEAVGEAALDTHMAVSNDAINPKQA